MAQTTIAQLEQGEQGRHRPNDAGQAADGGEGWQAGPGLEQVSETANIAS